MIAFLGLLASAAPPDFAADLARLNASADMPVPTLSAKQRTALAQGEVVRFIETMPNNNLRVVGFALLAAPHVSLFIASQHPRYASTASPMLIEKELSTVGDRGVWYGMVDLPRPFTDRHWVVNNWNNHDLARASDGAHWEHLWRLHPEGIEPARSVMAAGQIPGVDADMFNNAISTPASEGGVVFLDVGEGWTLVSYHSVFDPGGAIPERPMAEFVKRSMEDYFAQLSSRALEDVPRDYQAGSAPLIGADGKVIPFFE